MESWEEGDLTGGGGGGEASRVFYRPEALSAHRSRPLSAAASSQGWASGSPVGETRGRSQAEVSGTREWLGGGGVGRGGGRWQKGEREGADDARGERERSKW